MLDSGKESHYGSRFSEIVQKSFPSAVSEIEAGNNCLSFGQHTAAVFHFMRAVEHGLRTLTEAVGVTTPVVPLVFQEWQPLIDQIQSRSKAAVDTWGIPERTVARQFFGRVIGDLVLFKDDVRNVTMHTRRSYDESSALDVRNRVEAWFNIIAQKIIEGGGKSILDRSLFTP